MIEIPNDKRMIADISGNGQNKERYLIWTRPVNYGGMSEIYRGRDLITGIEIAAKFIDLEINYSPNPELIRKEGKTLAKLRHPHIPRIYDLVEEPYLSSRRIALIMEYLDLPTLTEVAEKRRLSLNEVAIVAHDIASAVDYARKKNAHHRDIKPENILLDKNMYSFLIDWGLVGIKSEMIEDMWPGTPGYMSPQAIWGDKKLPKSDPVFGFAGTIFTAVTGKIPFSTGHEEAMSIHTSVLNEDFNKRYLYQIFPEEKASQLEEVFSKGLDKNPESRIQTCTDFANAFAEVASSI